MGRLPAKTQMYIAIAAIAVVAIAVIFLVILPVFQEASSLNGDIAAEQSTLAEAQALLSRRQSAKAQSASNEVELMRIANQMPDSPQLPSVIIELQDVANAAGVEFESITPAEPMAGKAPSEVEPPAYNILQLSLVIQGDWTEIIDYVYRIQHLDRGVRITSITLNYVPGIEASEGVEAVEPYIQASVMLEVYMMSTAPTAPTTP
ncbi:MAG: type 4a pilus biogenesis protein PilO [Coriobacteriia bacterium]|nr:type 4a pilus biogenesis protein PilO [Coriobacteriia bacterium]